MKANRLGAAEILLLALIAVSGVMALRDRLPASKSEIARIGRLAAANANATYAYESAVASDPSMSIREARQLREKIASMSAYHAPALHVEEKRSDDDAWWQNHVRPLVPYAVGGIAAAVAMQLARIRRKRQAVA
ncbi:hypothetical protein IAG25_32700 [Caballeronia sp. EK]|uniref:hypothetical protein n=1 Tax=Caballeronia sp. EK TaxID=2767469 RepID=UPI0016553DAD|nr:hypothetical protein [Caballeronia sp. EK]MBC8641585.1 hypothetical protein [Caballeronia sp. EK]